LPGEVSRAMVAASMRDVTCGSDDSASFSDIFCSLARRQAS
jgi:hypothetical protein